MKIIECPRDAMQGLPQQIPTPHKIAYIQQLLAVGFDTLDFGSFVSPKAVPQMADTAEVLDGLDLSETKTKLLAIVANQRGVDTACTFPQIRYLGFPLSISETFQHRNTNADIAKGLDVVAYALDKCAANLKELVVYLSMAFGNPYQDPYSGQLVLDFTAKLQTMGCKIVSLADTVGLASDNEVLELGRLVHQAFANNLEIGMHLHSQPPSARKKIEAAYLSGIRRIDAAVGGLGGCPFAEDELVGNLPTEELVLWAKGKNITLGLDETALAKASHYLRTHIVS